MATRKKTKTSSRKGTKLKPAHRKAISEGLKRFHAGKGKKTSSRNIREISGKPHLREVKVNGRWVAIRKDEATPARVARLNLNADKMKLRKSITDHAQQHGNASAAKKFGISKSTVSKHMYHAGALSKHALGKIAVEKKASTAAKRKRTPTQRQADKIADRIDNLSDRHAFGKRGKALQAKLNALKGK